MNQLTLFNQPASRFLAAGFMLLLMLSALPAASDTPRVSLETDRGIIIIELYPERAPLSVANFIKLVEDFHYDGLIFHRVISGFMIQTGGFTFDMTKREPGSPKVINESGNGLKNTRGSIAMARTNDPHSAQAQFFINHRNNAFLNAREGRAGYSVFGQVVEGMSVVDDIASVATGRKGSYDDVPIKPIRIVRARLLQREAPQNADDSFRAPAFERPIRIM